MFAPEQIHGSYMLRSGGPHSQAHLMQIDKHLTQVYLPLPGISVYYMQVQLNRYVHFLLLPWLID